MLALQITASVFALVGTFLLRRPGRLAPWAFVAWLVSNPAAMLFMALSGHWFFFIQHAVFFVFAIESTYFWLVKPTLDLSTPSRERP